MAGLTAAWRLSEPGWQDRYESITVYQRGWRLGGKGASSRGRNGRIEEHGLHVWLGSYENAFTLLRECYDELDRGTTDPHCPIQTWDEALIPANDLGAADHFGGDWQVWLGRFSRTAEQPGDPDPDRGPLTVVGFGAEEVIGAMEALIDTRVTMGQRVYAFEPVSACWNGHSNPSGRHWITSADRITGGPGSSSHCLPRQRAESWPTT